jgi:predicted nucleotide-binding protein (sugar kinase/HSP70/actin superfamily)
VIGVVPFGCGPDSAMTEVLYLYTKRNKSAPFMILTLDEHSGEAGMITRLEAFIDMIRWRRKRPSKM